MVLFLIRVILIMASGGCISSLCVQRFIRRFGFGGQSAQHRLRQDRFVVVILFGRVLAHDVLEQILLVFGLLDKRVGEQCARGRTFGWIFLQCLGEKVFELLRVFWILHTAVLLDAGLQGRRRRLQNGQHHLDGTIFVVWRASKRQLERSDARTPDVRLVRVSNLSLQHFRRHPPQRASERVSAHFAQAILNDGAAHAKVRDLARASLGEQNVGRLQIAMHTSIAMNVVHSREHVAHNGRHQQLLHKTVVEQRRALHNVRAGAE
mmetsp:Transcript_47144/g.78247  ORF Transcript_47144/g.78247 Transcript_47144/m.78247 type:complete len:264 (-) Transcript_47144:436-1227(-)